MASVIWVEDQTHWIEKFRARLEQAPLDEQAPNQVKIFKFAEAALSYLRSCQDAPDIVILDANLNGHDTAGLTLSAKIKRKWPEVPILFLSEYAGTETEKMAFETTEAEDFIAKHQKNVMDVLCWRMKAVLRKRSIHNQQPSDEILRSGPLTLDLTNWQVYWHDHLLKNPKNPGRALAPMPRKILYVLVKASPRPLTAEQLATHAGLESLSRESYRQHIKTLRESIEQVCRQHDLPSFNQLQQLDQGIITLSDLQAYCWKTPNE